jgi:tripartite-type tricarboxylate transporter receptor subunit TctC
VWYGLWGPKGLPKPVTDFWNTQVRKALQMPDVRERLAGEGLDIFDGPPALFEDIVKRDVAKWKKVIAAANIKPLQ